MARASSLSKKNQKKTVLTKFSKPIDFLQIFTYNSK